MNRYLDFCSTNNSSYVFLLISPGLDSSGFIVTYNNLAFNSFTELKHVHHFYCLWFLPSLGQLLTFVQQNAAFNVFITLLSFVLYIFSCFQ